MTTEDNLDTVFNLEHFSLQLQLKMKKIAFETKDHSHLTQVLTSDNVQCAVESNYGFLPLIR